MNADVFKRLVRESRMSMIFDGIPIYFVTQLKNCTIEQFGNIVKQIEYNVPVILFEYVDAISVIDFQKQEGEMTSYLDGDSIYISSSVAENEIFNCLVHEAAHSFLHRNDIYSNHDLVQEFLIKRKKMYEDLAENSMLYGLSYHDFMNSYYDKMFDFTMNQKIGYEKIEQRYQDMFLSPQSMMSLEEYYCCGAEYYFLNETIVQASSPVLANTLGDLMNA